MRRMVRTRYTRNSRRSTTVAMSIHSLTWFPDEVCLTRTPALASGSSPAGRLSYMPPETHRHRPRQLSMICREGNNSMKVMTPHFTSSAHCHFMDGSRILQVGEGWNAFARLLAVPSRPDTGGLSPQCLTKPATALKRLCEIFIGVKGVGIGWEGEGSSNPPLLEFKPTIPPYKNKFNMPYLHEMSYHIYKILMALFPNLKVSKRFNFLQCIYYVICTNTTRRSSVEYRFGRTNYQQKIRFFLCRPTVLMISGGCLILQALLARLDTRVERAMATHSSTYTVM